MNGSCIAKGKDLYFLLTWPLASVWDFSLDYEWLSRSFHTLPQHTGHKYTF